MAAVRPLVAGFLAPVGPGFGSANILNQRPRTFIALLDAWELLLFCEIIETEGPPI